MHRVVCALTALAALTACTPSFEDAPEAAAATYCDRAIECELYGEGDYESCVDDADTIFDFFWDVDSCPNGITRDGWNSCMDTLETLDCDNAVDALSAAGDSCSIRDICGSD